MEVEDKKNIVFKRKIDELIQEYKDEIDKHDVEIEAEGYGAESDKSIDELRCEVLDDYPILQHLIRREELGNRIVALRQARRIFDEWFLYITGRTLLSEEERLLYKSNGEIAGLPDICKWWMHYYPEDIFVTSPPEIIKIRDEMKVIIDKLDKRWGNNDKIEESIRNARNRWEKCLKEAKGDLEKARKLYDREQKEDKS